MTVNASSADFIFRQSQFIELMRKEYPLQAELDDEAAAMVTARNPSVSDGILQRYRPIPSRQIVKDYLTSTIEYKGGLGCMGISGATVCLTPCWGNLYYATLSSMLSGVACFFLSVTCCVTGYNNLNNNEAIDRQELSLRNLLAKLQDEPESLLRVNQIYDAIFENERAQLEGRIAESLKKRLIGIISTAAVYSARINKNTPKKAEQITHLAKLVILGMYYAHLQRHPEDIVEYPIFVMRSLELIKDDLENYIEDEGAISYDDIFIG